MKKLFQIQFSKHNLLLLLAWILAILIVQPIADFPINDDFAYSTNVYNLAVKNKFILHEFPAMNLISQTIYGFVFVKCFGFSFTILRLSILILSVIASFQFKTLINLLTQNQFIATLLTVLLFFNSLCLPLSFSFMTDMFFLSMIIFAIYQLVMFKQNNRIKHYVFYIVFCVLAILNRQHGLILPLLALILLDSPYSKVKRALLVFCPLLISWFAQDQYRIFLSENHIANGIKQTNEVLKYIERTTVEDYIIRIGNSIVVLGLILFPVLLLHLKQLRNKLKQNILLYLITLLISSFFVWYIRKTFPIGNINGLFESGPKLIKSGMQFPSNSWHTYIRHFQLVIGLLSFSLIIPVLINGKKAVNHINLYFTVILVFSAISLLFLTVATDAYFDRYNIPVLVMLLLALTPATKFHQNSSISSVMILISSIIMIFSILEVNDYFNWQKARWNALKKLESNGFKPDQIDGGFEYNGWHHPTIGWGAPGKSWWWVKDDLYIIASGRISNYHVEEYIVPKKSIPISIDTIFVLLRNEEVK